MGAYDLEVLQPDGTFGVAADAFTVQSGSGPRLETNLVMPTVVRRGAPFTMLVEYANLGDVDMPAPILRVTGPDNVPIGLEPGRQDYFGTFQFLAASPTGPAGILRPGEQQRIEFYCRSSAQSESDYHLFSTAADPTRPSRELIDWAALEEAYRPPFADDATWQPQWKHFRREAGATWDEIVTQLAELATARGAGRYPVIPAAELMTDLFAQGLSSGGGLTDTQPPWVLYQEPIPASPRGIQGMEITFSESIDAATVTAAAIQISNPQGQPVQPITIVAQSDRVFRLDFPLQIMPGEYRVRMGTQILDLAGHPLDSGFNGLGGEAGSDDYVGFFFVSGTLPDGTPVVGDDADERPLTITVDERRLTCDQEDGFSILDLFFSQPILRDTFTPADVTVTGPNGNPVPVIAVEPRSSTHYTIQLPPQQEVGNYAITIAPDILDRKLRALDQNRDGLPGETGGHGEGQGEFTTMADVLLLAVAVVDRTPPHIKSQTPQGLVRGPITEIVLEFDEPINAADFTQQSITITGPYGNENPGFIQKEATKIRIRVADLLIPGKYRLVVQPHVKDVHGNVMGQYVGTFDILPPLTISGQVTYVGDLENFFSPARNNGPNVAVQLWDRNGARDPIPGEPVAGDAADTLISRRNELTGSEYTTATGEFVFAYNTAGNPILRLDGDGVPREYYVVTFAKNRDAFVIKHMTNPGPPAVVVSPTATNHDNSPVWSKINPEPVAGHPAGWPREQWGLLYHVGTPNETVAPPGANNVVVNVAINTAGGQDDEFWLSEWVHFGANWVRDKIKDAPRRQIAIINNHQNAHNAMFDWGDFIEVHPTEFRFPCTVLHEYGHAIHFALNDYSVFPYMRIAGERYGIIEEATTEDRLSVTIAEAWASFFAAKVLENVPLPPPHADDIYSNRSLQLETNDFWMGYDAFGFGINDVVNQAPFVGLRAFSDRVSNLAAGLPQRFINDGVNDNANSGDSVMGAVESVLWDLADDSPNDDDQVKGLKELWTLFDSASGDGTVRGLWNRSSQSGAFAAVFIDHGIDVTDDPYDKTILLPENDMKNDAAVLHDDASMYLDGNYRYPGLVMAEEGRYLVWQEGWLRWPGKADWFVFTLPDTETDPAKAKRYTLDVIVTTPPNLRYYGDLDLLVEGTGGIRLVDVTRDDVKNPVQDRMARQTRIRIPGLWNDQEYQFYVCVAGRGVISRTGTIQEYSGDYHPDYALTIMAAVPGPADENEVVTVRQVAQGPHDPNDKLGPGGFETFGYVPPDQSMPYTVRFENDPAAEASAVLVSITDPLDPDLDWNTFELGAMNFGDHVIDVPPGLTYYQTTIDLRPEGNDLLVEIEASFDVTTGLARWTFTGIDPATGEQTYDPLDGFLPPNNPALHDGEGYVQYTIYPKAGLPTGTEITNMATIVFDWEEPIDTPLVKNVIDRDLPASAVKPLPPQVNQGRFSVSWLGVDEAEGSGIRSYDVYVAQDRGPYELWLARTVATSAEYLGEVGHTYAFYSVATDNVGYREAAPPVADTQTIVVLANGLISGYVYADVNNNGIKEPWERGVPNVPLTVTGPLTETVLTDDAGYYEFRDLPAGVYQLTKTQPAAFLDGKETMGPSQIGQVEGEGFGDMQLSPGCRPRITTSGCAACGRSSSGWACSSPRRRRPASCRWR